MKQEALKVKALSTLLCCIASASHIGLSRGLVRGRRPLRCLEPGGLARAEEETKILELEWCFSGSFVVEVKQNRRVRLAIEAPPRVTWRRMRLKVLGA